MSGAPLPANDPRAFRRLEAADHRAAHSNHRSELIAAIAKLQPDLLRRKAELAADEALMARKLAELVLLEQEDERLAAALAKPAFLYVPVKEAAYLAQCSVVTMKRLCRKHGFGFSRDGRWWVVRDELMDHLANVARAKD